MGVRTTDYVILGCKLNFPLYEKELDDLEIRCEEKSIDIIIDAMCGNYIFIGDILVQFNELGESDSNQEYISFKSVLKDIEFVNRTESRIKSILNIEEIDLDIFYLKHYH